jgi:AraC-like DNA-binding protein
MVVPRDPLREWRERFARRWLKIDFKPLSDAPFKASALEISDAPQIVRWTHSPGISFRDDELVKDGVDCFSLLISLSRNLEVTHYGRELRLEQGDATLLDVRATGTIGSSQNFRLVSTLIPRKEFEARVAHAEDMVMQHLGRGSDILRLLGSYIRFLERGSLSASPEGRETSRRHIIDLVALAVTLRTQLGESSLSAVVAARLATVLDYITANFHDPELSVGSVACHLNISPRYLQCLMERSGATFTARVNELRLQWAFMLLNKAEAGNPRRIADIALEAGFSDISHFNRLFRSRFGDTPGAIRAHTRDA